MSYKTSRKKTLTLRQAKYFELTQKAFTRIKINRTSAKFKIVFKMWLAVFLSSYNMPTPLQCDFSIPHSQRKSLFLSPLNKPWSCDLLGPRECGRSDVCKYEANFHTHVSEGHLEPSSPVNPPFESSLMNNPRPKRRCLDKPCNCEKE